MTTIQPPAVVRRATDTDHPDVARLLSAGFADDPVFEWMIPDRATRARCLTPFFSAFAGAVARRGEIHLAGADGVGHAVALWAPPGVAAVAPEDDSRFVEQVAGILGEHMDRFGVAMAAFDTVHPHEPAWYLPCLAVEPAHQGRGLGSVLLRAVLDRADAAGDAAYLEATSRRNRALYERHGFRHLADIPLPDGPTVYAMWRRPGPAQVG
jgi:ribosomal protein S18 acetylase RimI-like enzyme